MFCCRLLLRSAHRHSKFSYLEWNAQISGILFPGALFMKFLRGCILFYIGGTAYLILEFLWRGRSHGSMFFLGGLCFLLVGGGIGKCRVPLPLRPILGAGVITGLELITGLLVNRDYAVWDYRDQPFQFQGQICLAFSLLWVPVSLMAMELYALAQKRLMEKLGS